MTHPIGGRDYATPEEAELRAVIRELQRDLAAARADAARYRAAWQEAERGLMKIVLRADTDPSNLTSGMLASDFRGSAMKSLSDARAALANQ